MAKKKEEITAKQWEVYLYLIGHVERYGYQPTLREMGEALGVDKRAITWHLHKLQENGLVQLPEGKRDRAIRLSHVRFEVRSTVG